MMIYIIHDQASERDHDVLRKFLHNVIKFGTGLSDVSLSECGFCVWVVGPKIRELNGNLGDILGRDCCFFSHDDALEISR